MGEERKNENAKPYAVGHGKPPKATQFRKGTSGNPTGRPKGAKGVGAILAKMGRKRIKVNSSGRTQSVTMLEALILQLISRAAAGDLKAIRDVLAAHRLYVQSEEIPEIADDVDDRDAEVIKNLLQRLSSYPIDGSED